MQILRREQYLSMPWRNGAGSTLQIARAAAKTEPYSWRLSLASIAASGPFSIFNGYQRCVVLVQGGGFVLSVGGQAPRQLQRVGEALQFAGDAPTRCSLVDGPCLDLSLMTRLPLQILQVRCLDMDGVRSLPLNTTVGECQALFALRGPIAVDASHTLQSHDTALLLAGDGCELQGAREAQAVHLRWQTL